MTAQKRRAATETTAAATPPADSSLEVREAARLARRHPWPTLGYVLMAGLLAGWWQLTSPDAKLRALLGAATFSAIEFTFYAVTVQTEDGEILLRPFDPRCRAGHTTWHQFFGNILYTPLALDAYFAVVQPGWLRIALFPLNIWLLEVVMGYTLIYLYGYNPAWTYYTRDAYFSGNIKLSYLPYWLALGAVTEFIYPLLVPPTLAVTTALFA